MAYRLEAHEKISLGVPRLLLELVDQIIHNLTNPEMDRDTGVHEARKNCKRVRAAYRLIRDEIGVELYRQENIRFRDTARQLAGVRDSWVMVQTLDQLVRDHPEQLPAQVSAKVRGKLIEQYQALLERETKDQTKIPAIVDSLHQACDQIEKLPTKSGGFSALRGGIRRVYFRGRRAFLSAYSQPTPEIFHEWRKRVKYLWHNLEILEPIRPDVLLGWSDDLHTLSDYLGADHDLIVFERRVLDEQIGFRDDLGLANIGAIVDQKRQTLEAMAQPLGEKLYRDSQDTFVQRLETYWNDWQSAIGS